MRMSFYELRITSNKSLIGNMSGEQEIQQLQEKFMEHFNSGKISLIGDLYTKDSKFMSSGMPIVEGREGKMICFIHKRNLCMVMKFSRRL